jgi:catechol 2,3-dioxygenase-like lactoylglutathione lyase family enzyme
VIVVECSCCGLDREPDEVAALRCHAEVTVCRGCIEWLRGRAGGLDVTPTLPVRDMAEAIRFYQAAGFDVRAYDDGFAFVHYADSSVFDLDHNDQIDPSRNGAGCYIIVPDADAWHDRLTAAAVPVTPVADMPWGMREFALTDPSGNRIRVGHSSG